MSVNVAMPKLRDETRDIPLLMGLSLFVGLLLAAYFDLFDATASYQAEVRADDLVSDPSQANPIPPALFAIWLFACCRHHFARRATSREMIAGVAGIFIAFAIYGWAIYTRAVDLQKASLMFFLAGAVTLSSGTQALRACTAPIMMIWFFTAPSAVLLSSVLFPTQLATATIVGQILDLIGVEAIVAGDRIVFPNHAIMIIEACSGLRMVLTITMLSLLTNQVLRLSGIRALLLVLFAPLIALAANVIRIVVISATATPIAHHDHSLQGMLVFGGSLSTLFAVGLFLDRGRSSEDRASSTLPPEPKLSPPSIHKARALMFACTALLFMIVSSSVIEPWSMPRVRLEKPKSLLDRTFVDYESRNLPIDWLFMGGIRALDQDYREVEIDGETVTIYIAIADELRLRSAFVTRRLAWPTSGLKLRSSSTLEPSGGRMLSQRSVFAGPGQSTLSYSWYQNSNGFVSEWVRNVLGLDRSPFFRPTRMAAIRISAEMKHPSLAAEQAAERRIKVAYDLLVPQLEEFGRMSLSTDESK